MAAADPLAALPALHLQGRERACRIERPVFLAPMDGITDHIFRRLVVELGGVGAVCSEFARISVAPLPGRSLRRCFGAALSGVVNGLQLMAPDAEHLGATAARVADCGAEFLDLNFGCPVKRVVNKCAGSALLAHPQRMAAIVDCAVRSQPLPVTVKMRPGIADADRLEELLDAVCAAGASLVALHHRLRVHSYRERPSWDVLRRAAAHLHRHWPGVPLIGNGGIDRPADATRMLRETGVDGIMIGQAALADPFLFRQLAGGPAAGRQEAVAFLLRYHAANRLAHADRLAIGRTKQAIKYWRAAGLFDETRRRQLLRLGDADAVAEQLQACAAAPAAQGTT